MRIVSLAPAATEILFALGCGRSVVGRSYACDHPGEALLATPVTVPESTEAAVPKHRLLADRLLALHPDVVVTTVDGFTGPQIRSALPAHGELLSLDPAGLEDVIEGIAAIGTAVGAADAAAEVTSRLRIRLARLKMLLEARLPPRVAIVEWPDPLRTPGRWVPELISAAGGVSAFGDAGAPSRPASHAELSAAHPDTVVLAFAGMSLYETQAQHREVASRRDWLSVTRAARLIAIDGPAYVHRPGPRLVTGAELLAWALHRPHPVMQPPTGKIAELIEAGWVDLAAVRADVEEHT